MAPALPATNGILRWNMPDDTTASRARARQETPGQLRAAPKHRPGGMAGYERLEQGSHSVLSEIHDLFAQIDAEAGLHRIAAAQDEHTDVGRRRAPLVDDEV